jgi:hypothetical protein
MSKNDPVDLPWSSRKLQHRMIYVNGRVPPLKGRETPILSNGRASARVGPGFNARAEEQSQRIDPWVRWPVLIENLILK